MHIQAFLQRSCRLVWTPRLALWTQPPDLDPYATAHVPGGLLGSAGRSEGSSRRWRSCWR